MKPTVLAKVSMQVSEYFRKSYELSQTNQMLKQFDGAKFANIQQYHSIYFKSMAWFIISQDEYKKVEEQARGMGLACALLKATAFMMEKGKAVVLTIPANYQDNFNNKFTEIVKLRDKALKDNSSIYFERETPIDQLPKPDCQNFVKMEAVLENMQGKIPIEDKLRHIVPPEVRAMQNEVKNQIQEIINQQYEVESKKDAEIRQFL